MIGQTERDDKGVEAQFMKKCKKLPGNLRVTKNI